jgi:hypothetical protein
MVHILDAIVSKHKTRGGKFKVTKKKCLFSVVIFLFPKISFPKGALQAKDSAKMDFRFTLKISKVHVQVRLTKEKERERLKISFSFSSVFFHFHFVFSFFLAEQRLPGCHRHFRVGFHSRVFIVSLILDRLS